MALTGIKRLSAVGGFREREMPAPGRDEVVFFENVGGSVGGVELAPDGGVILSMDQLTTLREFEGDLKKYLVERRGENRYYVNLK